MGRKLQHVVIFLLIILKEPNMPGANYSCEPSHCLKEPNMLDTSCAPSSCWCRRKGLTSIPPDLPPSIESLELRNKPETTLSSPIPVLIGSVYGPVAGIVLMGTIIVTVWYKKSTRNPPLGLNPNVVGGNTNAVISVSTSSHDNQYKTGQGQAQANIQSPKAANLSDMLAALKPNAMYAGNETLPNNPTIRHCNEQTGQGQSQAITESNTNTTATVMTSGHDQTGQGQSQVITESNTNTTATEMTSGHDQTGKGKCQTNSTTTCTVMTSGHNRPGQGQSQTITESNTNRTTTEMTSGDDQTEQGQSQAITESSTNTATVMTSGHDQTEQGQSQAITESNRNTTATEMTSVDDHQYEDIDNPCVKTGRGQSQAITESNTNTTGIVMTSGHDQTGQGQSQTNTETLDARNLSYGTGPTVSQLNSLYKTTTVMTSGHDHTGQGQSQAIAESNTTATVMTSDHYYHYEDLDD
ncbi:hypothetical protein Bbelb_239660 [Branchiostoma belcheri]|nr:hypothetical protein Bbelb_239660 [Branchiostoma belcheri]